MSTDPTRTPASTAAIDSPLFGTPPTADGTEYLPYYDRYITLVPAGDVLDTLDVQLADTVAVIDAAGESRAGHRYAEGKWSVRQLVGHVVDTERIFTFRALAAARGETGVLPAFDENAYVEHAGFDTRSLGSLFGEWNAVRRATLALFRNLDADALGRRVVANGGPLSARAAAWIIAGHELHHREILRQRYL